MLKFLADPTLLPRFSQAQLALRNQFDIATCAGTYLSLYGELAG